MTEKKFDVSLRETLFQGYYRVDRAHVRHERFDGTWSPIITREVYERGPGAAGVLLFDPQHDKVMLVEQFRIGPLSREDEPWMLEIVLGMMDAHELPEQTARREAMEEAGCSVLELQPIASVYTSPGGTSEFVHLYVGRTTAPAEGGVFGLKTEHEDIRVHVMDAARVIGLLYANKIRDSQTLIAIQWFAMHHTELRSRWLVSDVGTPII